MENVKNNRPKRKTLVGTVISDKMNKTRVVEVERRYKHPLYEKIVRTSKKYYAHDELNSSKEGDVVEIMATRPLSKLKRWRVYKVISRKTV